MSKRKDPEDQTHAQDQLDESSSAESSSEDVPQLPLPSPQNR